MKEIAFGAVCVVLIMPENASTVPCDGFQCKAVYCWMTTSQNPKFNKCYIYVKKGETDTSANNPENRHCIKNQLGYVLKPFEGGQCDEEKTKVTMEQHEPKTPCVACEMGVINFFREGSSCNLAAGSTILGTPTRLLCIKK